MAVKIKMRKRIHKDEFKTLSIQGFTIDTEKTYYNIPYISPNSFKYGSQEFEAELILFIEAKGLDDNGSKGNFNLCVNSNNQYNVLVDNKTCTNLSTTILNGKQIYRLGFKIKFNSGNPNKSNTAIQLDLNLETDTIPLFIYLNL